MVAPQKKEKKEKNRPGKGHKKKKGGKRSKKKRSANRYESETSEDHKVRHSKRLSLVFEEADGTFKEIRQRLSNLSIKKSLPKDKTVPTEKDQATPCSPSLDWAGGLERAGGKAGKSVFFLLVGHTDSLYRSSKKSKSSPGALAPGIRTKVLDLHGCSGDEATKQLDEALPSWVDAAMMRHPFVIPVDVVCGGGAQILSEVVDKWVHGNKRQVANRPKSFC
ncbi:hypothetical protein ACHAWF_009560 [Thalassiosira exigua]